MLLTDAKRLEAGHAIPHGYGVAWIDYEMATAILHRIPLHLVVRWWHNGFLWFIAWRPSAMDRRIGKAINAALDRARRLWETEEEAAFQRGKAEGYKEGWGAFLASASEMVERRFQSKRDAK